MSYNVLNSPLAMSLWSPNYLNTLFPNTLSFCCSLKEHISQTCITTGKIIVLPIIIISGMESSWDDNIWINIGKHSLDFFISGGQLSTVNLWIFIRCSKHNSKETEHLALIVNIPSETFKEITLQEALERCMVTETRELKCVQCESQHCRVKTMFTLLPRYGNKYYSYD